MLIQPYQLDELQFAYCNRVFFRAYTHRRKPIQSLAHMNLDELSALLEPYQIHLLELATTPTAVQAMISLLPSESISIAASKVKGRISKWISSEIGSSEKSLGRGYFAATVGQSTATAIDAYLKSNPSIMGTTIAFDLPYGYSASLRLIQFEVAFQPTTLVQHCVTIWY